MGQGLKGSVGMAAAGGPSSRAGGSRGLRVKSEGHHQGQETAGGSEGHQQVQGSVGQKQGYYTTRFSWTRALFFGPPISVWVVF